ncbi:MAG: porin [Gammaproteobacteria bacterium]|nr:porin [Gammaproteobacteria bacterium]
MSLIVAAVALSGFFSISHAAENVPNVEELWEIVQQQQAELAFLRQELEATRSQVATTQTALETNTEIIESVAEFVESPQSSGGLWAGSTTIGGYGEMLYNNETSSSSTRELDVQRFVLFFNHEFNDDLRFVSELEIEHSFINDDARSPGAVELEQAYLEWDFTRNHSALAGMYLAPIGILNETHEPNTFFGVERNRIESRIIPSTFRVNGVKLAGRVASGWSYDLGVHEGLFFESGNGGEIQIRDSRQSGARSEMDDLAYTGRLRYTGIPGLELGIAAQYQSDMTQSGSIRSNIGRDGVIDISGNPVTGIDGLLTEAHLVYRHDAFGFRALYAQWNIDSAIETVANSDLSNNGLGRDEQYGFYLEPSFRINNDLGIFARYEETDERAGSDTGAAHNSTTRRILVGLNYWLTDSAVLKFDYQFEDDDTERDLDGFNVGIGWQF